MTMTKLQHPNSEFELLTKPRKMAIQRMSQSYLNGIYRLPHDPKWTGKLKKIWSKCESDIEQKLLAQSLVVDKESLLEVAVKLGRWTLCHDLLDHGADPTQPFSSGRLIWSSLSSGLQKCGWVDYSKFLETCPPQKELSCFLDLVERVAKITPGHNPPRGFEPENQPNGWGSIQNASMLRNPNLTIPVLTRLVDAGHDINMKDEIGETAFLLAAWQCEPTLLSWLLEHGADPQAKTMGGWNAWSLTTRSCTGSDERKAISGQVFQSLQILNRLNLDVDMDEFFEKVEKLRDPGLKHAFDDWRALHALPQSEVEPKRFRL